MAYTEIKLSENLAQVLEREGSEQGDFEAAQDTEGDVDGVGEVPTATDLAKGEEAPAGSEEEGFAGEHSPDTPQDQNPDSASSEHILPGIEYDNLTELLDQKYGPGEWEQIGEVEETSGLFFDRPSRTLWEHTSDGQKNNLTEQIQSLGPEAAAIHEQDLVQFESSEPAIHQLKESMGDQEFLRVSVNYAGQNGRLTVVHFSRNITTEKKPAEEMMADDDGDEEARNEVRQTGGDDEWSDRGIEDVASESIVSKVTAERSEPDVISLCSSLEAISMQPAIELGAESDDDDREAMMTGSESLITGSAPAVEHAIADAMRDEPSFPSMRQEIDKLLGRPTKGKNEAGAFVTPPAEVGITATVEPDHWPILLEPVFDPEALETGDDHEDTITEQNHSVEGPALLPERPLSGQDNAVPEHDQAVETGQDMSTLDRTDPEPLILKLDKEVVTDHPLETTSTNSKETVVESERPVVVAEHEAGIPDAAVIIDLNRYLQNESIGEAAVGNVRLEEIRVIAAAESIETQSLTQTETTAEKRNDGEEVPSQRGETHDGQSAQKGDAEAVITPVRNENLFVLDGETRPVQEEDLARGEAGSTDQDEAYPYRSIPDTDFKVLSLSEYLLRRNNGGQASDDQNDTASERESADLRQIAA